MWVPGCHIPYGEIEIKLFKKWKIAPLRCNATEWQRTTSEHHLWPRKQLITIVV